MPFTPTYRTLRVLQGIAALLLMCMLILHVVAWLNLGNRVPEWIEDGLFAAGVVVLMMSMVLAIRQVKRAGTIAAQTVDEQTASGPLWMGRVAVGGIGYMFLITFLAGSLKENQESASLLGTSSIMIMCMIGSLVMLRGYMDNAKRVGL